MPASEATPEDYSSQARYFFDLYTGPDAVATIQALPGTTPKTFETNWLEFKSGFWKDEEGKANWSRALGSFANGGGGVLIWGIQADRSGGGPVDCVQKIVPVADVNELVSRLKQLHPQATDPPIKRVEITPLLLPGKEPAGFVVCYIPESDSKPHRSEFGKDGNARRFYLRIGDSTAECSVPILRQLFYPKYSPRLSVTLKLKPPGQSKNYAHISNGMSDSKRLFGVRIYNAGPASVFDMYVRVRCEAFTLYKDTLGKIMEELGTLRTDVSLHPSLDFEFDTFGHIPDGIPFRGANWIIEVFGRDLEPKRAIIPYDKLYATYSQEVTADCL